MRPLLYVFSALAVMGLAFWAYRQNYATQRSLKEVAKLQREIGRLHDQIQMQQAEWAYENRPSRLRRLVRLNFDKLQLLAMQPEQFGAIADVAYPASLPQSAPQSGSNTEPSGPVTAPRAAAAVHPHAIPVTPAAAVPVRAAVAVSASPVPAASAGRAQPVKPASGAAGFGQTFAVVRR